MHISVSDEARRAATKCEKVFSCLEGGRNDLCEVESCIDGKVHFLKCLNDSYCSYQQSFGYGVLCSCPVRMEIFNKFKK